MCRSAATRQPGDDSLGKQIGKIATGRSVGAFGNRFILSSRYATFKALTTFSEHPRHHPGLPLIQLITEGFIKACLRQYKIYFFPRDCLHLVYYVGEVIQPGVYINASAARRLQLPTIGFLVRLDCRSKAGRGRIFEILGKRMVGNTCSGNPRYLLISTKRTGLVVRV